MFKNFFSSLFFSIILFTDYVNAEAKKANDIPATVVASRSGFGPARTTKIIVAATDSWIINTNNSMFIYLDDKTLYKTDAKFNNVEANKAKEVTFVTKSTSSFGIAKLSLCNAESCKIFTINFNIIEK
jgi:hypothetical protein